MFDLQSWAEWFRSLDRTLLFLLILPLVVTIFGLWSHLARTKKGKLASEE